MPSVDILRAARRYLALRGVDPDRSLAHMAHIPDHPDESFCREVADHFAQQPRHVDSAELSAQYTLFKQETLQQYRTLLAQGIRVRPWRGAGAPYRGTGHLVASLRQTGTLFVLLTRDHHGPPPGPPAPDGDTHPLRAPSGIRVDGVTLCHNDLFRAVHDAFGHAMYGHSMGPVGEFRATWCHMQMYSPAVHPVLFTEQISQICWFFYGPHLRTADGRLPAAGTAGWVPPPDRPYPPQKVFPCPPELLARFRASLAGHTGTEPR